MHSTTKIKIKTRNCLGRKKLFIEKETKKNNQNTLKTTNGKTNGQISKSNISQMSFLFKNL